MTGKPTDNELIHTLIGEMMAVQATLKAIIAVHPEGERLGAEIERQTQRSLAFLESSFAPDAAVAAFQRAVAMLRHKSDSAPPNHPNRS